MRWTAALAATALLAATGCSPAPAGEPPPHLVLVVIDQLRKDSCDRGCVALHALATHGVVFDEMRSVAPWTYPSVVSMLSGLYPQQHGAGRQLSDERFASFDREVPLVQKSLRAAGFRTAAFVTNMAWFGDWNPLHEGFDTFRMDFILSSRSTPEKRVLAGGKLYADTVNHEVRQHYDARPVEGPEFTYLHYMDVHGPWLQPPFPGTYEDAVRFVDAKVAEIHGYFAERYAGDLIFVVTSDHGRALGDDEAAGHGAPWREEKHSVHDFNLRIPLMILPGKRVPEGLRIEAPVANVDIAPTLLAWAGLEEPIETPGESLLPLLRGEPGPGGERPLYSSVSAWGHRSDGVVWRGRKYMRFFDPETGEETLRRVFDLGADPRETTSLSADFGEADPVVQEASGDHGRRYEPRFEELSSVRRGHLEALGYLR